MCDTSVPGGSPGFDCVVEEGAGVVWVRPVGEVDMATAPVIQAQLEGLRAEGCDRIVVDLRGTTFIDSSGLRVLVGWHQRSVHEGFGFAIVDGPRIVQRVMEVSGLYRVLRFVDGDEATDAPGARRGEH